MEVDIALERLSETLRLSPSEFDWNHWLKTLLNQAPTILLASHTSPPSNITAVFGAAEGGLMEPTHQEAGKLASYSVSMLG